MRTTIEIDERLLSEAMKLSGERTKKGVVHLALAEFVRRRKLEELARSLGTVELGYSLEDLERDRADV